MCTRRRFQPDTSLRCQWLRNSWFRGRVRLGMAFDLNLMRAQTMMLRWNGSRLNANNLIETLPSNLAGGQSFRSHAATQLLLFQSRDGKEHVLILMAIVFHYDSYFTSNNQQSKSTAPRCLWTLHAYAS